MIDYYSLPETDLPMSMRCLRKILKERGWKAEKLSRESLNNIILTRPDGKIIKIASSTPPTTSVYALRLADNKMMSYELLRELNAPQPETKVIRQPEEAEPMLQKYGSIVIKPIDGAHGNGVTTDIQDIAQVTEAIDRAEKASPDMGRAIMQPQLPLGELEVRVICIGYRFVAAIARIPAQVTGDGTHTIKELIDIENQTIRTEPYKGRLAYIDKTAAHNFLAEKISGIPALGERVRVVGSCNLGQGGTVEDYSTSFPEELRQLSEKVAKTAELPVVGIDFYGDKIIELNACPMLYYPIDNGSTTKTIEAYVDYLASL